MTPAARYGAAIEILDQVLAGTPAEKALTTWARRSRFAGSKDRAAIRDHVFDVLRRKRSVGVWGGGVTGRAMILGLIRQQGIDPASVFSGEGHAPEGLSAAEQSAGHPAEGADALDLPDWLLPEATQSLGDKTEAYGEVLRHRAPVMLRVNSRKLDRNAAIAKLTDEGISAVTADVAPTALRVVEGARRINNSEAYRKGLVELQDGASQAVVEALPLRDGLRILDLCAGGGGKSLAMAGKVNGSFYAYDAHPQRLRDLSERAKRAGVKITLSKSPEAEAPFDLVLCDVPCSGSGSWRRSPEGKWALTEEKLQGLNRLQDEILERAASLLAPGGTLAYATCSVFDRENTTRVDQFLAQNPAFTATFQKTWIPGDDGDGFHLSILTGA